MPRLSSCEPWKASGWGSGSAIYLTSQLFTHLISPSALSPAAEPLTRDAFEAEALRWTDDVFRFALSMTRDEADAEDVVQDTYLRAFRSWRTFAAGSDCRRWLFTICRNVFLRTRERSRQCVPLEAGEMEAVIADASLVGVWAERAAERFTSVDVTPAIYRAVSQVPEPFRSAVIAVDLEDQSYEAAADKLGVPIGTVRSRLFRGRRLLQEQLRCYALDLGVVAPLFDQRLASA
jgi:RNA polymerase sigma-70 factor (ECF subfamily)